VLHFLYGLSLAKKGGLVIQNNKIIELKSLSFSINEKILVDEISLDINIGDMVSVVGPNGSGKSTLVKLISSELEPSSGQILIYNKSIKLWGAKDLSKFRGVLSQSSYLSFPFSTFDIVKMGRYPFSSSKKINDDICSSVIKLLDLDDKVSQIYTTLSGGEKQRVQLARILAQIWSKDSYDNKLLILDEPTSFLDIKHQFSLFKLLKTLNEKGLTVIMVLHDINHALSFSQKIIMLNDSKLIEYGHIEEIINSEVLEKLFNLKLSVNKNKKTKKFNISFADI